MYIVFSSDSTMFQFARAATLLIRGVERSGGADTSHAGREVERRGERAEDDTRLDISVSSISARPLCNSAPSTQRERQSKCCLIEILISHRSTHCAARRVFVCLNARSARRSTRAAPLATRTRGSARAPDAHLKLGLRATGRCATRLLPSMRAIHRSTGL